MLVGVACFILGAICAAETMDIVYARAQRQEQSRMLVELYRSAEAVNSALADVQNELASIARIEVYRGRSPEEGSEPVQEKEGQVETGPN